MLLKELLRGETPLSVGACDRALSRGSAASAALGAAAGLEIRSLCLDSRRVIPGSLFFALPGSRTDGARYVREAVEKGAAAVVSELKAPPAPIALVRKDGGAGSQAPGASYAPGAAGSGTAPAAVCWVQVRDAAAAMGRMAANFYGDPSAAMTVVGVTGTNGKTTITYLLESVFSRACGIPGVVGTINHRLRGEVLETAANTTPLSLDLQRLLARMRDGGGTHVAMEVSSHALALKRVEEVRFDAAIMTNLRSDHLDFHKTREAYFEAKARLFELLERADSGKERRVAVLNRDDETYARLRRRVLDERLVSYGRSPESGYRALDERHATDGTTFRIARAGGGDWPARLRLIGGHNVLNALAAFAAAVELGVEPDTALEGLAGLECVPGRLEPVDAGQGFQVYVDYAHTEDALQAALGTLAGLPHKRILTVFGCGGDRDATKRSPMGAAACRGSDLVFATSDNPRGEDPVEILRQVEAGMRQSGRENYRILTDRKEAIFEAVRAAREGDIVLIAGKGHETVQILKDKTLPFDDRRTVREALAALGRS